MNLEHLLLTIMALILGACVGSFLNVVVYRLPAGLSLVHPPSRCPHCHHPLQPWDNIPVFGWILIGGKCRYCRSPVSWRYPAVEAFTGGLFAVLAWAMGHDLNPITLLFYGAFTAWLLALALIDLDTMTLPDRLTKSGLVLGLVFQLYRGINHNGGTNWAGALLFGISGMVTGLWLLELVRIGAREFMGREAMGGGDPKLAAMIGMWLGWQQILLVIMLASFLGMISGLVQMICLRRKSVPFPFGPWLSVGALLVLVFGEGWIYQYLKWWGLAN